ncbi:MAG: RES family NAD+ phosphorylase [Acidobacteria bacterium]|nr:RES family NAD+ phosphorylase [Acidobacteriota bacterium]
MFSATWNDGDGAFRYGGRWNSQGKRVLYVSSSLALATLEVLVNLDDEEILPDFLFASVAFAEEFMVRLEDLAQLPPKWRGFPIPEKVQKIGDDWIEGKRSAILEVPTSVIPKGANYVINLEHPDSKLVQYGNVENLILDSRLIGRTKKK